MTVQFIKSAAHRIALRRTRKNSDFSIIFCGGFKSSMEGSKARALEQMCRRHALDFTRFDYSGHGSSDGEFICGNIDTWLKDTLSVIDSRSRTGKIILIGSSMGAWLATLAARNRSDRIAGLITIAAAPDFTERLLLPALSESQLATLKENKPVLMPSSYDDGSPYPITAQLIDNSRQHCLLNTKIEILTPVRMLHGTADIDVPFRLSIELMGALQSGDVQLNLIKGGDHRLSSPDHLLTIEQTLQQLLADLRSN